MGDRALIQLYADGEYSPALYLHWSGQEIPTLLQTFYDRFLAKRGDDLEYGFARLVQYACEGADVGSVTGVGVSTVSGPLTVEHSPGDAGVFIADLTTMEVRYGYGYAPDESAAPAWTFTNLEG